tara:strand:+ start:1518 stop:1775 length:258 start_codon:yes stop_codon:yes gene_type:complete
MTQKERILKALEEGRELTPKDAINEFGCFRLSARICDLKEEGHNIITTMIKVPTSDYGETHVASYKLMPIIDTNQLTLFGDSHGR